MRWIELVADQHGSPGVLREAVRSSRPATLLRYGQVPAVEAHFESIVRSHVVLRLQIPLELQEHEPITVAFLSGERVAMFLSRVTDTQDPLRPRIALPGQCYAEMRRHPRVRVGPNSDLESHVQRGGMTWSPWVGDLSRGGARLCFDGAPPDFGLGSLFRLKLRMHQHDFSHTAMVVRMTDDSIGCRFQPMEDDSTPALQLSTLIALLERKQRASS